MVLGSRKKLRLYVIFQHRNGAPGFHWAIQLAPKNESARHRSMLYDATNTIDVSAGYTDGQWRYRVRKGVDVLQFGNVVARVLVAKIPVDAHTIECIHLLDERLAEVPMVQGDPNWRCASWLKAAVESLRSLGGMFGTIPEEGVVGTEGISLAENSLKKLLKGEITISSHSEIPVKDIRIRTTN